MPSVESVQQFFGIHGDAYGALDELIQACWQKLADDRPDFEQIAKSLASIHKRVNAATEAGATTKSAAAVQRAVAPKHTPAEEARTSTSSVQGGARSHPPVPKAAMEGAGQSAPSPPDPDKP